MAIDLAAQVPALVGSILSCLATAAVLVVIINQWSSRHSLRHVLIANLIFSEFANSLNNTISGIYIIASGDIPSAATGACVANGFIGQLTVQATDFSVLAMAISTLVIVLQSTVIADSSLRTKVLAITAIWVFPLVSSITIAGLHAYGPVSGNWCWIVSSRNDLRYGLTHGIRFAIIIATVIIYGFIFRVVKHKLQSTLASSRNHYGTASGHMTTVQGGEDHPVEKDIEMANLINKSTLVTISLDTNPQESVDDVHQSKQQGISMPTAAGHRSSSFTGEPYTGGNLGRAKASTRNKEAKKALKAQNKQNVARIMLMRAYPFSYVILWLPGIANRLAELMGHPTEALVILQASTQFIGLVDSVLYVIQWRILKKD